MPIVTGSGDARIVLLEQKVDELEAKVRRLRRDLNTLMP